MEEASPSEIVNEIEERQSENPIAYRSQNVYELKDCDLDRIAPVTDGVRQLDGFARKASDLSWKECTVRSKEL